MVGDGSTVGDAYRIAEDVVKEASARCNGFPNFVAGLFANSGEDNDAEFDRLRALEMARYAVAPDGRGQEPITGFSEEVAVRVLANQRKASKFANVLKDYHNFAEMGIRGAQLENIAAICAIMGDAKDYDFAQAALTRAIEMVPSAAMYHANLGVVLFQRGARTLAYQEFEVALSRDGFKMPENYLCAHAMSAYSAMGDGQKDLDSERVQRLLTHTAKLPMKLRQWIAPSELQDALYSLTGTLSPGS